MRYSLFILFTLLALANISAQAQEQLILGDELLKRSISFHDPNGQWAKIRMELVIDQEMPDGSVRPSNVILDNIAGEFELSFIRDSHLFTWKVDGRDSTESFMDYRIITDSIASDTLGLKPDRARRWRNYYRRGTSPKGDLRSERREGYLVLLFQPEYLRLTRL